MEQQLIPQELLDEFNKRIENFRRFLNSLGQSNYTFDQYERIFSDYGWYIPYKLMVKDIVVLVNKFENNEIEKADTFLVKFFKKEFLAIKEELIKSFPERKNILLEAFSAHKKKMFYASTILFLSQADGITKNKIFLGGHFKKFSKAYPSHSLVKLFEEKNHLTAKYNKNSADNIVNKNLNRHGIMHGLQHNYGTEINSFKALSFLLFVSNFRNEIK